ncbi:MAG: transcription termination factor NusA [Acidobacteriota bacterium]
MPSELYQAIEAVGREKGIDVDIIVQAVQDAIVAAARKYFKTREELVSRFDRESGALEVFALKRVVSEVADKDMEITLEEARNIQPDAQLEDAIEIRKPREALGRIAAQAAKQVIYQKVREAERENVYGEYSDRVGDLVNGIVKRFERGDIILDLGRTEAALAKKEQSRSEHYNQGDRVRAIIVNVDRAAKGPQVIVSRTDPRLLMKLFEMEVPEIYDGTVTIENAARDPGDRAKIAVRSKDRDVDPVGACVGMKGSRVQAVIRELRGEKIDIVQYSDDATTFVANALNPARASRVAIVDEAERIMEVVVEDDQLSQAIGKRGQNVRLASRLIGWRIDIKSEAEKLSEVEIEMARLASIGVPLEQVPGVGPKLAANLQQTGYTTVEQIAEASIEDLQQVPLMGEKTAQRIQESVRRLIEEYQAAQEAGAEEEAAVGEPPAEAASEIGDAEGTSEEAAGAEEQEASLAPKPEPMPGEDPRGESLDSETPLTKTDEVAEKAGEHSSVAEPPEPSESSSPDTESEAADTARGNRHS